MKTYVVRLSNGETSEVSVEQDGDFLRLTRDGQSHQLDLRRLPGAMMHMLIDGRASYDCVVEWAGDSGDAFDGSVNVLLAGRVHHLDVLDQRRVRMRDAVGSTDAVAAGALHAPMPGRVLRYLVEVGDHVEAGQGLVVVEAMKMENELAAAGGGRVEALHISAGENVDKGVLLVSIEAVEE
jgi:pyruvate carboxylase subunit B